MQLGSWAKLIVAVVVIIALTLLMALNTIDQAVGMGPITLIVGYIIGNGVTSAQGKGVQSIIEPKNAPKID